MKPGHQGYYRAVTLDLESVPDVWRYPFTIPAVRSVTRLELHPAVTFLVGENGSGKSTLLEALAVKMGFNAEGGSKNFQFSSRSSHSDLHEHIRLERTFGQRATDGYFLRAESFYNLATETEQLGVGGYGGKPLHEQSHGEAFLALLTNRLEGGGVYLFDEPEAALSPQRQLAVLTHLHRLVRHRSQFIIATHSPILLAYPHAWIYSCSESGLERVTYEETEHYRVTKDFLNQPGRMIQLLLSEEDRDLKQSER